MSNNTLVVEMAFIRQEDHVPEDLIKEIENGDYENFKGRFPENYARHSIDVHICSCCYTDNFINVVADGLFFRELVNWMLHKGFDYSKDFCQYHIV